MNILIVHPCKGFYGGAEEVVVQLCKYLEASGHYVRLITKNNPKELETWTQLPKPMDWWEFRTQVQALSELYDVINVHNAPAPLMTFPTKKPIVYMCNEPTELFTTWWRKPIEAFNRWWVRKSGMKVVVADEFSKERFKRIYGVESTVIPYGVDYEFWSRAVGFKKVKGSKVDLLQVGTVSEYKNQEWSIRTLEALCTAGVDATLTLVGRVADREYHGRLCKHSITEKRVRFLGQKSGEQVRSLYHQHDILLHPVLGQGGWLVPLEAWCTNLPVITTPEFQMSSLFDYVALDEQEAADMIIDIMQNGSKQADGSWIKNEYSWDKFGASMLKIFKEVAKDD